MFSTFPSQSLHGLGEKSLKQLYFLQLGKQEAHLLFLLCMNSLLEPVTLGRSTFLIAMTITTSRTSTMCPSVFHAQRAFCSQAHEVRTIYNTLVSSLQTREGGGVKTCVCTSNMPQQSWRCFLGWSLFHFLYVMF